MQQAHTHTLPSAPEWTQTFGSRGPPQSPAGGGRAALTASAAGPLFPPHRTSHLRQDQGIARSVRQLRVIHRINSFSHTGETLPVALSNIMQQKCEPNTKCNNMKMSATYNKPLKMCCLETGKNCREGTQKCSIAKSS